MRLTAAAAAAGCWLLVAQVLREPEEGAGGGEERRGVQRQGAALLPFCPRLKLWDSGLCLFGWSGCP